MSSGEDGTPQIIGWVLTGIGILGSLGWNLFNHRRTTSTANALRIDQYRLSQWTRIRGRIQQSLDDLVSTSRAIVHQARGLDEQQFHNSSIDLFNDLLVNAQDDLASALEEATISQYCDGDHWSSGANGPVRGTETAWDVALSCFELSRSAATKTEKMSKLQSIREPISQIRDQVLEYCRVQDLEYDPDKI